jgi:hypothetical protein
MIEEFLHVFNGQQVLMIHGNDNGIPYLRNKDLQGVDSTDAGE